MMGESAGEATGPSIKRDREYGQPSIMHERGERAILQNLLQLCIIVEVMLVKWFEIAEEKCHPNNIERRQAARRGPRGA